MSPTTIVCIAFYSLQNTFTVTISLRFSKMYEVESMISTFKAFLRFAANFMKECFSLTMSNYNIKISKGPEWSNPAISSYKWVKWLLDRWSDFSVTNS